MKGKHSALWSKSNGTGKNDTQSPKSSTNAKRNDGLTPTPNFFHRSENIKANSLWWITFSPIKIQTRVIWWTLAALQSAPKR